jgi:hypothetical protein
MFTKRLPAGLVRSIVLLVVVAGAAGFGLGQADSPAPRFHIYAGNTHSHSEFTWSHGEQFAPVKGPQKADPESRMVVKKGVSYPPKTPPRADWKKHQGPPSAHYAMAKANGYDFYVVSDHSQEAAFHPTSSTNPAWLASKKQAAEATDDRFVAIAAYEHSENNGPDGKGHLSVFNSSEYLNALEPGTDLRSFYRWLKTARPNGDGPVVASFNHPGPRQYSDWAFRDPEVTDIITMLEVINSNKKIHCQAFTNALDKGWKVSPVCGNDNHGFYGITHHTSRTFVLATSKTKAAILDAMKHRRTYASVDGNLQCRCTVNGAIMGSTLDRPEAFKFEITISDPDTDKPGDKITKIDIVKDGGAVVETYRPTPAHSVTWSPTIHDAASKYFFVRVWNAGGGAPRGYPAGGNPEQPVAWLAPVWTGR